MTVTHHGPAKYTARPRGPTRSGSLSQMVTVSLTHAQKRAVMARAAAQGLTVSEYGRALMLADLEKGAAR